MGANLVCLVCAAFEMTPVVSFGVSHLGNHWLPGEVDV